jgi:hypothetical protein
MVSLLLGGMGLGTLRADDHLDAPRSKGGPLDLAGLYVFRSPANANNTVFILTLSPFADFERTPRFQPGAKYEFKIDLTGDGFEELTFQFAFGGSNGAGQQKFQLFRLAPREKRTMLASGLTGTNVPIATGGMTRAGLADDPAFADQAALDDLLLDGVGNFPRNVGTAKNFYGPTANVLALVVELPSASLVPKFAPGNSIIGVWGRVMVGPTQADRVGRPFVNKLLIPPISRNSVSPTNPELRLNFNRGRPPLDLVKFSEPMQGVLTTFYGRTPADAAALADLFLPDMLIFQLGNPNGFGTFVTASGGNFLGNGRRLRDDVFDFQFTVLTNGTITSDNVPDDNGTRITDGNAGSGIAFPYIGAPNIPGTGPNP